MKRDMELIRKLLVEIEQGTLNPKVSGHEDESVNYHKALLVQRGLAEGIIKYSNRGDKPADTPDLVLIQRLTWEGHDFIEAIADESKWAKIKAFLIEAGKDVTIESIKIAAKQLFGLAEA